jgi:hypothetical protein
MSRARKLALVVLVGLVLLGAGVLWALPEILRRVALDQIPKRTGRALAIGDIDLNLFTGHLAIESFRLADREGPEPFVAFERLTLRLSPLALLRSHVHVREIALAAPSVRVVRTGSAEFNFSDLLGGAKEPGPEPEPGAARGRWNVTVERLSVSGGRVRVTDRAVAPPAEWAVEDLGMDGSGLTTRPGAPPGRLALRTKIDEAALDVSVDPLRLEPRLTTTRLTLDGFQTGRLVPYVHAPLDLPHRPKGARLALALTAHEEADAGGRVMRAVLSGTVKLEGEALVAKGQDAPFLAVSRLDVDVREANPMAGSLTIASVALEGLDLRMRRDAKGAIEFLDHFVARRAPAAAAPRDSGSGPATPAPPPERRMMFPVIQTLVRSFERIRVERITLAPSTATFVDETVSPTTTLALTQLRARIDDFTWPVTGPASLTLSTGLPGGGTLDVAGPVTAQPFDATLTVALRNAPVEPYQAYIPVPARLSGRFNGDSKNRIAIRDGTLVAQSKGNSWARNVEIREPGAERPAVRVDRMDLVGIDFDWPKHATVVKAGFRRLRVEVERSADGSINLRRLFKAPDAEAPPPAPEPRPAPGGSPPGGLLDRMRVEFGEARIEDGVVRFLDRTTQPAFSQDLTRLAVTLTGYGSRRDRRARLALQSVVGGDASLDIRGEIGLLGSPAFADLVGELRSFSLPSVDPYATSAIGWVIKKGELQYKVRFKLDGDQLSAENDLVIGRLQVAPASGGDEVKRRIGLPLGLIVALIKDQQGEIHANVPVTGALNDPRFALGDAVWTAVKNVLVNIVAAPFKAIGRLFTGGDGEAVEEPRVEPVAFPAGSSVVSPAMEEHLLRVADFLRRSPFVSLALTSAPGGGDVEALKTEAVAARIRELQRERGAPDLAATLARYYGEQLPGVPLPATVEEQLALLREREPTPEPLLSDLGRRRLEATRARLVQAEGIPESRLTVPDAAPPPAPAATGEGRVEFAIVARE